MSAHWSASEDFVEISRMPFYWRLSDAPVTSSGIAPRMGIRVEADPDYDYLKFVPTKEQWDVMSAAYRQNENIGFLNPESGQMETYGSSVNSFLLDELLRTKPRLIVEIGCGAGFSIQFLRQHGFNVLGVDPSEYSRLWSERLGFQLVNDFFREGLLDERPQFVYCNDVLEHVREVVEFSATVYDCLADGGTFCFSTTNSTRSIEVGDISMFEHQHVNMFTNRSIALILSRAGFVDINIRGGNYGNTFQVRAVKRARVEASAPAPAVARGTARVCEGYFERAAGRIRAFERFYEEQPPLQCYVPLRSIPYLACVGDFGMSRVFDSNFAWHHKYIDGYEAPIEGVEDIVYSPGQRFFVASLTFLDEIKATLIAKGYPENAVQSIRSLP